MTTLSERHRVTIHGSLTSRDGKYQPECSCGWLGPVRNSILAAEREHDDHVLAAGE